jgi:hypothetical protein
VPVFCPSIGVVGTSRTVTIPPAALARRVVVVPRAIVLVPNVFAVARVLVDRARVVVVVVVVRGAARVVNAPMHASRVADRVARPRRGVPRRVAALRSDNDRANESQPLVRASIDAPIAIFIQPRAEVRRDRDVDRETSRSRAATDRSIEPRKTIDARGEVG